MNGRQRFHILHALRYFRYGLLLCLIPMVRALLAFDLPSFRAALGQDAAILIVCAGLSLALWAATGFWVTPDGLETMSGVFCHVRRSLARSSLAALEICRPLHCRILGASRVVLYFRNYTWPRTFTLYLTRRQAEALAARLMPVRDDALVFAPTGFERLSFVMLSANVLTAGAFGVFSFRQINELLGQDIGRLALGRLERIEELAERFLPVGLAVLAALLFTLVSFTFLYTLLRTAGFSVCRSGGVILSRGGLITHIERRIFVDAVSACEVRVTPVARLLRRRPVYLSAGSFSGGDLPLMVFRRDDPAAPAALLAGFCPPDGPLCTPARKSPVQYLWLPGTLLVLSAALCAVAMNVMPDILPVLAVPVVLCTAWLAFSAEGIFREGIRKNENRTLSVCFSRFFTRHEVCVLTSDIAYTLWENPFSVSGGRCNATVHLPGRVRYTVRGVLRYAAADIPFTL